MADLVAAVALIVLVAGIGGAIALRADRNERRRQGAAHWEVTEVSVFDQMHVFVCKVDGDGDELDRARVAVVPNDHPDWDARVAEARARAASRAALLNTKP